VEKIKKVSKDDVETLLKHISMRMQLHRISKAKLASTLFGANFDKEEIITVSTLSDAFRREPLAFTSAADRMLLARFLLEQENTNFFTTDLEI
jgi:hypothetical protein